MIYFNMPEKYYHENPDKTPLLSASIAKILWAKTPYHAWERHPKLNPNFMTDNDQKYDFGSACHALLLEQNRERIFSISANDWRTKEAKRLRDEAYLEGKIPLLEKDVNRALDVEASARAFLNESELKGLPVGDAEVSILATLANSCCEAKCKSRLDFLSKDHSIVIDYKTTKNANPEDFSRQIFNLGYDIQAAFYRRMVREETGHAPTFLFLVQEDSFPYLCSLIGLSPAAIELGNNKLDHAITLWAKCLREDSWPAYPKRVAYVDPPPWDINNMEETLISREVGQL